MQNLDNVSSETMHEANLRGAFADHPKEGAWSSERGTMCSPWELSTLESRAEGSARHQAPTHSPEWNDTIIVQTPVTRAQGPDGKHKSNLPNHSQYAE